MSQHLFKPEVNNKKAHNLKLATRRSIKNAIQKVIDTTRT